MRKLSNTEFELKKCVGFLKKCVNALKNKFKWPICEKYPLDIQFTEAAVRRCSSLFLTGVILKPTERA